MALHIERWLGRDQGGSAEVWLAQQAAYDLWQARQAIKGSKALSGVKPLKFQAACVAGVIDQKQNRRHEGAWIEVSKKLAERVGFEPTVGLHLRLISSQVHSTTLPPLRSARFYTHPRFMPA